MPVKRSATRERKIRTHASVDLAIVEVAETFDTVGSTCCGEWFVRAGHAGSYTLCPYKSSLPYLYQ